MRDEDGGRGARNRSDGVMLGDPEAVVAERFDGNREIGGLTQRLRGRRTGANRREIENRKWNHGFTHLKGAIPSHR